MEQKKQFIQKTPPAKTTPPKKLVKTTKKISTYQIAFHNPNTAEDTAAYVLKLLLCYLSDG
jgi:hypothetical protein